MSALDRKSAEANALQSPSIKDKHKDKDDHDRVAKNVQGRSGVTLIPRPSDDPRDPLNWSTTKKYVSVAVLSFSTFAGFTTALATQLEVKPFVKLYGVASTQVPLQNSASLGGMIVGSVFMYWVSLLIGRQAAMFWSLLGCIIGAIWGTTMTAHDDFTHYLLSRAFSGFFGTVVGVLGPRCIIDMFFLHQRGRAYTIFHFWFDLGNTAGPSICAFIATPSGDFRWALWFCIIIDAVAFLAFFLLMHDTTWDRSADGPMEPLNPPKPQAFLANRITTFFPGSQITPRLSIPQLLSQALVPFKLALTPVSIVLNIFTLLNFGFYVAMNSVTPAWLQKSVALGGYGFTPFQNALFQFFHWGGIALALPYGQFVSDRIPLWVAARFGNGDWKPEYRLHALWLPALICNPLGMGLFGYGLDRHMSWGFLGFSQILVTYGSLCITPITVNYLSECFTRNTQEAAIVLNAFRIGFGLSIAFYINPWVEKVGFSWCYGTMSFIQIFSFMFCAILMWKGHEIRKIDPFNLACTEDGEHVIKKEE